MAPPIHIKVPQNGLRFGYQSIPSEPDFLTRKCMSASTRMHFLRQTEILRLICNDCLRHLRIFCGPLLLPCGAIISFIA